MNVLVTGAAGFIGSNFVHMLARERSDWNVTALDLLTYAGNLENISSLIDQEKLSFVKADICDEGAIKKLFNERNFELVFNFAAESHVDRSIESASEFARTNVLGTQNLLNSTMSNNVRRFIQVSTDEVYGSLGPTGSFLESTPLDPTSPYAASKAGADLLVLAASKTHNADVLITRCTNNYGPYQFPEKFIPLFVANAAEDKELPLYGDGMNVRSWLHVDDHCRAILMVAENGQAGEVYNIGGNEEWELPNKIVAQMILKHLGKPESLVKLVTDRPAHDLRYSVDCTKIKQELGWEPTVPFEQGLAQTIDWYLDNKNWWESIRSGDYLKYYDRQYSERLAASQ